MGKHTIAIKILFYGFTYFFYIGKSCKLMCDKGIEEISPLLTFFLESKMIIVENPRTHKTKLNDNGHLKNQCSYNEINRRK